MQLIALTGGIAAGKSTIGDRLAELGAIRIDADQLAREAVEPGTPGLERIAQRFGTAVLQSDGSLDRAALGAVVFADPEALHMLNAIVHPEVYRLFGERVEIARENDPDAVVVYEIPLLVESGNATAWDLVITAEAPVATRVKRMIELRGMAESDARARIAQQTNEAARRARADVVIDTSGSAADTASQVDALWARLASAGSAASGA